MTVSDSIIKWLKTFNPQDYWRMKSIDTGIQSAAVDTYSLVKTPVVNTKTFLSGRKVVTAYYTLMARLANETNTDRIENDGFGEALESWVEEQRKYGNYPELEDADVQDIQVTTPFYVGMTEEHSSVYNLSISIRYMTRS